MLLSFISPFITLLLLLALFASAIAEVNHYDALGVKKDATQQEIRSAYKKLSLKYHPDKNAGSQEADEKFAAIAAAYDILGDADKRSVYDTFGSKTYTDKQQAQKHSPGGAVQQSFYESASSVHALSNWMFDGWSFQGERAKGPLAKLKTWMIEFYAPWCVHCQNMVGAWKKAASILDGEVGFGAVNCEAEPILCRKWNIHSYPTVTYVSQDEATEMVYSGEHTVEAFVSFARSMTSDAVVTVRPHEFDATILQSPRPSMVLFNAGAWCGPCQSAKTRWRMFASKVSSEVTVATVDCDKYRDFCNEMNVSSYPHVRGFGGASGTFGANLGEELFQMRSGLDTSLEIIEKTIQMMARNHASSGHDEL